MRPGPLTATLAAVLAVSASAAVAQNYDPQQRPQTDEDGQQYSRPANPNDNQGYNAGYNQGTTQQYGNPDQQQYQQQQQQYQDQQQQYRDAQQRYQGQQQNYQARQDAYRERRARYEADRANWEAQRAAYDERYGEGAYVRRYGVFTETWTDNGAYRGYVSTTPNDWYTAYRDTPCEQRKHDRAAAGTVIGALAGAALGSNIASGGGRMGGAIIGGVAGAAVGNNIARSSAHCDRDGAYYYYSYDDTQPWRDSGGDVGSHSSSWYRHHGCRLVTAPVDTPSGTDWRWTPVCPGPSGRYVFPG